jgi:hypothetical protein
MSTSVAHSIPEEFRRAFADNVEFAIQDTTNKFSGRVRIDSFTGKEKIYNHLEETSFERRNGRLQQSAPIEAEMHARKMVKMDFRRQFIFDKWDREFLGNLGLPTSEVIQNLKMAWNRLLDSEICKAATATVYGGVEPYVTAIDIPSTQEVAKNYKGPGVTPADTDLNPQKIIKAREILLKNGIDPEMEPCVLAIDPIGETSLMAYVEASTNDVWGTMIATWLQDKSKKLFGFEVVCTNNIQTTSANTVSCFAYSKERGIYMSPDTLETSLDVRPDLDHALQVSAYGTVGFMRRQEKAVVEIFCHRA